MTTDLCICPKHPNGGPLYDSTGVCKSAKCPVHGYRYPRTTSPDGCSLDTARAQARAAIAKAEGK